MNNNKKVPAYMFAEALFLYEAFYQISHICLTSHA